MKFCNTLAALLLMGSGALLPAHAFDEDLLWQEAEITPPPAPNDADLIQFNAGTANPNRFYVDGKNIAPGADGVMRYTLVVVAPSGSRNVSFEGIRCKTGERRLYAVGGLDGSWLESNNSRWQGITASTYNRHHLVLMRDCFCDMVVTHTDRELVRENLRSTLRY